MSMADPSHTAVVASASISSSVAVGSGVIGGHSHNQFSSQSSARGRIDTTPCEASEGNHKS